MTAQETSTKAISVLTEQEWFMLFLNDFGIVLSDITSLPNQTGKGVYCQLATRSFFKIGLWFGNDSF